ncbi:hypothetical protein AB0L53_46355 [Nonomuraea sp. NPDC052129]|uniref:AMP-binding enzyme n=1 Tax=unclassified Nonomuraea TaxID=2593643 RepID=UPI00343AD632
MINCGGEKIAPFEVEEVLRTHPGVEDVVVFGVPDSTYGDAVACLVVPRASARCLCLVSVLRMARRPCNHGVWALR